MSETNPPAAPNTAVAEPPPAPPAATARPTPAPAKPRQLPPYKVLLHNDDVSPMNHVVRALRQLTPLNGVQAETVMMTAHRRGVALVLVTHLERAELYVEQFRTKRLVVTIEPA
jgi:ATP-dependent Clp protease adaptor protein ClpS